jgi:TolB-like protein/class 3 adenylate cyclase
MPERLPQRRLAAILAADVVGYSRMMQADEAGTLAALKSCRTEILQPLVSKHHGRIIKVMGDGVLVEFASAVEAVSCAAALQEAMAVANEAAEESRRVVLRIGINLGDVMVEGSDLYGDGVNIAARLEEIAEPGSIVMSRKVHEEIERKLTLTCDDLGEQPLKNITQPVRIYRVARGHEGKPSGESTHHAGHSKPSIAVLPFANMSGDPEQEYFSDGITEDIITELSRFRNLVTIARNSSFHYKGKSTKIETIARELNVQYVLEGSVRRAGQRVRVTAQLIDANTSRHVWAERYDRDLTDIFAVQDEVARNIVGTMAVEIDEDSLLQAKRKPPQRLRAYEHWLQGIGLTSSTGGSLEARKHFVAAITVDPAYSRGYSGLCESYGLEALDFQLSGEARAAAWEIAFSHAQKAMALDETDYWAHLTMAWWHYYHAGCDLAQKHFDRALNLNPNAADLQANAAYLHAALGNAERGISAGQTALRLNPHHPDWYLAFLCFALFTARRYPEALAIRNRAPRAFIDSPFFMAATLAHMDRRDEARHWADIAVAGLAGTPAGVTAVAEGRVVELLVENNPYCRQEDRDHFAEGMRKAGVPG